MTSRLALAALVFASSQHAFAQTGPDPKLCASVNAILAQTPKDSWPEKSDVTLEWEGGSSACVTKGAGILTCDFFNTQMMSADRCKLFKDESSDQMRRDGAARVYASERAMPALQACFADARAFNWAQNETSRASQGYIIQSPGKPAFRFGETNRTLELAGSQCAFNAIGFEFDPEK